MTALRSDSLWGARRLDALRAAAPLSGSCVPPCFAGCRRGAALAHDLEPSKKASLLGPAKPLSGKGGLFCVRSPIASRAGRAHQFWPRKSCSKSDTERYVAGARFARANRRLACRADHLVAGAAVDFGGAKSGTIVRRGPRGMPLGMCSSRTRALVNCGLATTTPRVDALEAGTPGLSACSRA